MINKCGGLNNLNNFNGLECGHHLCESLYGQATSKPANLIGNSVNLSNNNPTTKNNEQETPSLNSCSFNSAFSLPQSMMINDSPTNFRSLLDLNTPLIYLDYNKGNLLLSFFFLI